MKRKVIAIHQPNFLPWLGFFHKLSSCEYFVLLDDVEFSKNSYINRNRIKTKQGAAWITMPVKYSGRSHHSILETQLMDSNRNGQKVLKSLQANYGKAPFFKKYFPDVAQIISEAGNELCTLNIALIQWAMKILEISTPYIRSSELDLGVVKKTDRLVAICKTLQATHYLAGFGGKQYQEEEKFTNAGIALMTSDFEHPIYDQLGDEFLPNLSVIDYIFNVGSPS